MYLDIKLTHPNQTLTSIGYNSLILKYETGLLNTTLFVDNFV